MSRSGSTTSTKSRQRRRLFAQDEAPDADGWTRDGNALLVPQLRAQCAAGARTTANRGRSPWVARGWPQMSGRPGSRLGGSFLSSPRPLPQVRLALALFTSECGEYSRVIPRVPLPVTNHLLSLGARNRLKQAVEPRIAPVLVIAAVPIIHLGIAQETRSTTADCASVAFCACPIPPRQYRSKLRVKRRLWTHQSAPSSAAVANCPEKSSYTMPGIVRTVTTSVKCFVLGGSITTLLYGHRKQRTYIHGFGDLVGADLSPYNSSVMPCEAGL